MERPRYTPLVTRVDRVLELIAKMSVLSAIVLTVWHYGSLPESVPSHFNLSGATDAYSTKQIMWVLPVVALILYGGLTVLSRYPHALNYPFAITPENAPAQYTNVVQMIRWTKVIVLGQLSSAIFFQHQVIFGNADSLPAWWIPVFLVCMAGVLIFFGMRAFRFR